MKHPTKKTKQSLHERLLKLKSQYSRRWLIPLIGLVALIWFLIRVIPKPSRATYPCQRAAFPFASAFVIWLVGTFTSLFVFKQAKSYLQQSKKMLAVIFLVLAIVGFGLTHLFVPSQATYGITTFADEPPFVPSDGANNPMGEGKGIFPGRVVWNWNPDATSWNGSSDYWWSDQNTNQTVIDEMLSETIQELTGEESDEAAWDALFKHHNGGAAYTTGEKIAIKLNLNAITNASGQESKTMPTPQMVLALTRQLVDKAGVNDADITFFDAGRIVPDCIYDRIVAEYPNVNFKGKFTATGRTEVEVDYTADAVIHWSSDLKIDGDREEGYTGEPSYFIKSITEASYMINLAIFRAHHTAGVTLGGKNHFGSFRCHRSDGSLPGEVPKAAGLHQMLAVHDVLNSNSAWSFYGRPMDVYNPITNLMGHKHTGGKTILYLIDGFYPTAHEVGKAVKFNMAPFNNDWASSLFASQDPVAIESVCVDFLRTEQPKDDGDMFVTGSVDNYLHEAALAHDAPSGTVYDPENDGTPMGSLGAHEHWNNSTDMQYYRNLCANADKGIELVGIGYNIENEADNCSSVSTIENRAAEEENKVFSVYPNPVVGSEFEVSFEKLQKVGELKIINLGGQVVYARRISAVNKMVIDDFIANPGYYMIVLETPEQQVSQSILIQ